MTRPIRVLIADDHPVYRDGLRHILAGWSDAELVGEATDGDQAVQLAARLRPDVVLMDLQMPGRSGVEATRAITTADPDAAVLLLTMFEEDEHVAAAMRAGARGYLVKGATGEELRSAIATAASGAAVFGPTVARRLAGMVGEGQGAARPFPDLTEREHEVLDLMAQGRSNAEIARRLAISEKTVRNYVSLIFDKLQVIGRAEAIVRAREAGMGGEHRRD